MNDKFYFVWNSSENKLDINEVISAFHVNINIKVVNNMICFIFVSRKTVIHRSHAIVKHGIWWNFRIFSRLFHENDKIHFDPIFFLLLFIESEDLPFS